MMTMIMKIMHNGDNHDDVDNDLGAPSLVCDNAHVHDNGDDIGDEHDYSEHTNYYDDDDDVIDDHDAVDDYFDDLLRKSSIFGL